MIIAGYPKIYTFLSICLPTLANSLLAIRLSRKTTLPNCLWVIYPPTLTNCSLEFCLYWRVVRWQFVHPVNLHWQAVRWPFILVNWQLAFRLFFFRLSSYIEQWLCWRYVYPANAHWRIVRWLFVHVQWPIFRWRFFYAKNWYYWRDNICLQKFLNGTEKTTFLTYPHISSTKWSLL